MAVQLFKITFVFSLLGGFRRLKRLIFNFFLPSLIFFSLELQKI